MWSAEDLPRAPPEFPPRWACAWGDDPYGLWADIDVSGVQQRMRWIEPGSFLMGSTDAQLKAIQDEKIRKWAEAEKPQHAVTLSEGYWLADTLCAQAVWLAAGAGDNPSYFKAKGDEKLPVENVSWDDVQAFLAKVDALYPDAAFCALPSEAEWEYACRAGTMTAYWWGDQADAAKANMASAIQRTSTVKHYSPNPWGLHDMHGNLWEWCADSRRGYADRPEVDPHGGTEGARRVLRGGSGRARAEGCRSACRSEDGRVDRSRDIGFRFALRSRSPGGGAGGR